MVAISADSLADGRRLTKRLGLAFPLLSDSSLRVVTLYGVKEEKRTIAGPSTFVVGRNGRVRYRYLGKNPADRPPVQDILAAIKMR